MSSLGGSIEQRALAHDPLIIALAWITGGLKIVGGLLALALVQPWGRRLPRRTLLLTAWTGATLLSVYGALQLTGVALIKLDVVTPTTPMDPTVLLWRLLLWEPWFLVWGLLLGMTAWFARRRRTNALPLEAVLGCTSGSIASTNTSRSPGGRTGTATRRLPGISSKVDDCSTDGSGHVF